MLLCLPALFLTFGKVNGAKIDRFFFFFGGGFLTFGKVNGAKIDRFFFLGGGFLTLGKVNCHGHGLGVGAKIDRFSGGREGGGGSDPKLAKTKHVSDSPSPMATHFDLTVADSVDEVVERDTPQDMGQQAERSHWCSESDTESVRQIRRRRLVLQFEPDPAPCQGEEREDPRELDDETKHQIAQVFR